LLLFQWMHLHPIVAKFPFVSGHHHISWSNDNLLWFNLQYPPAIKRGLLEKPCSSMIFPARHFWWPNTVTPKMVVLHHQTEGFHRWIIFLLAFQTIAIQLRANNYRLFFGFFFGISAYRFLKSPGSSSVPVRHCNIKGFNDGGSAGHWLGPGGISKLWTNIQPICYNML
jgi:hypothetical protein